MTKPSASTLPSSSDEALALRARAGCRSSFEELVRRHQVPLVHFLRRWTTIEDAEDLTQETMLRAYENLHRYRPAWKYGTWLFTIARRLCLNRQRRRRAAESTASLAELAGGVQPGDQIAQAESDRRLWDTAADVLSDRERMALWLYYAEDMPVAEIARVVGRSATAVKTMLFRSRQKLARVLCPPEPIARRDAREEMKVTHE